MPLKLHEIENLIRDVPDFPKSGILFKDITPVLANAEAFQSLILLLEEKLNLECSEKPTVLVGIESRGFILGAALAQKMNLGFVPVRKPGKLPHKTLEESYSLEYGKDSLFMHIDALTSSDRVVIVDDLVATGGTALAATRLCARLDAKVLGVLCFVELAFLKGAERLEKPLWPLSRVV